MDKTEVPTVARCLDRRPAVYRSSLTHEVDLGTQDITRFLDDQGNLIRVEDQLAISILHRNTATGQTRPAR
jgi:hypothetical protein